MTLIDREELKDKLDRGEQLKLVMTLPEWDFKLKHIPGSICVHSVPDARRLLKPDDQIVVYSSCPECPASQAAARLWNSMASATFGTTLAASWIGRMRAIHSKELGRT